MRCSFDRAVFNSLLRRKRSFAFLSGTLLWVFLCFSACKSTEYNPSSPIKGSIGELHEGTLIVMLPSNDKKLRELDRLINIDSMPDGKKKRMLDEKQRVMQERELVSKTMAQAFKNHYDFSKHLFTYDHLTKEMSRTRISILNENQEIEQIELPENAYFLSSEYSNETQGYNVKSWKLRNSNLEILPPWYPNSISIGPLKTFFRDLFKDQHEELEANAIDIAKKLNKKFFKALGKSK